MRIAMIGHKKMPSRDGGVEVVVTELATRMASLGHEVTVYNRAEVGQALGEFEYKGVRVRVARTVNKKGLAAASSSYFATRLAIADKPDVIHFHAEGPCAMIPLARRAGLRTIATIHGLDWRRAKWGGFASAYIKRGERIAAKQADEIIVLSRGVQGYFEGAYGRQTSLIPNGITAKELVPSRIIGERYGLEEGSYILYLGRIVPEKGLHYLIDAFSMLATEKKLVIAGAPSDSRDYYARIRASADGDSRIVFTGFVQGPELAELFSNAYLYVLPSDLEGMPMSLLEASSYGCCSLTSDIPECTDVLDGAGVTFRRGDVEDLRATLAALLMAPESIRVFGRKAKEVVRRYDWDTVVDRTVEVYKGRSIV